MKYYEVLISAFATVVVKAETEKEASRMALDDINLGDLQMEEAVTSALAPEGVDSAKRHADMVIED